MPSHYGKPRCQKISSNVLKFSKSVNLFKVIRHKESPVYPSISKESKFKYRHGGKHNHGSDIIVNNTKILQNRTGRQRTLKFSRPGISLFIGFC